MNISEAKSRINQEIESLAYGQDPEELYTPIHYIMNLGGKRMRPLLTLLGTYLFSDDPFRALRPAIGVEMFHNFTLMHDDIMDNAPLRRGQPTVHEKWNDNIAILSGDVMLVKAYELLMGAPPEQLAPVLRVFNQCASLVCEGQQLDMNYENRELIREGEYIEMIRRKTAVLLGCSLEIGAIIAGADPVQQNLLRDFGENIGLGFQLMDDLLDVYGDAQKFGKQVGGDIIANKKTFLLIKALEDARDQPLKSLQHWLNQKKFDKSEKVRAVTEIYNQLDIRKKCEVKMQEFFQKGFQLLESLACPPEKKAVLKGFTEVIINREK